MKVIIAGSRTITSYEDVKAAINKSGFAITEVVSGAAEGVDKFGEQWAKENGIPIASFPITQAQWVSMGKSAGYFRNMTMAQYADALILVWGGQSRGSDMMRRIARMMRMPFYEYVLDGTWF